jgi:hypothetical protein
MSGGGAVHVNLKDLAQYGRNLTQYSLNVTMAVGQAFATMAPALGDALESMTDGGVFAEATIISDMLNNNMDDFRKFADDTSKGIVYTSAAALVIAASYSDADLNSKASIDDVGFAFGDGGKRPAGLPKDATGETFRQQQASLPAPAIALTGDPSKVVGSEYHPGYESHEYADGSYVTTTTRPADGGGTIVETTVYDASGKVLRRTSQSTGTVQSPYGSYQVSTTTQHEGDPDHGADVKTVVTKGPGGDETIETTTTGADGKTHKTTTTTTATVQPDKGGSDGSDPGPIKQAEDRHGSKIQGDPGTYQHLGPTY